MSEIKVDTLTGKTSAGNITVTDASVTFKMQDGLTKVDAGQNASTTLEESLNVASLTDVSSGKTYINFANNTATAGYAYNYSANAATADGLGGDGPRSSIAARFTNYCYAITYHGSAYPDSKHNGVQVNGDLA